MQKKIVINFYTNLFTPIEKFEAYVIVERRKSYGLSTCRLENVFGENIDLFPFEHIVIILK